jgi:N-acetylglucosaminyldiphosphoundecaprenol N-acetyl-beta-D-mannosaminyltransferase
MKSYSNIEKISMFGYKIFNMKLNDAAMLIANESEKYLAMMVVTPNVDHFVNLNANPLFRSAYEEADMIFADGAPIVVLSKMLPGTGLVGRVTGADLFPLICKECAARNLKIAIVGTSDFIAVTAKNKLLLEFPGLVFAGHYSPPIGFESSEVENQKIIGLCNDWKPNILVLALGAPKQELWAAKHKSQLNCGSILCFGAAVDFYSGIISRAPLFVRQLGMEWLWRLIMDPKRLWRRYLVNDPIFVFLALKELFCTWRKRFM